MGLWGNTVGISSITVLVPGKEKKELVGKLQQINCQLALWRQNRLLEVEVMPGDFKFLDC